MIEVDVEGESSYEELTAYVSLDNKLTQVEDTDQPPFYLSNGKAFKFSNTDQGWCTRCNVYLMVSIQKAGKFFVTPTTYSSKEQIIAEQYTRLIVNQQGQECLEYTIASITNDLVVEIFDLEGTSKVTVNPRTVKGDQDTSLVVSPLHPKRVVALSPDLRTQPGTDVRRGEYQVCVNAIQKSSVLLKVEEKNLRKRYTVEDDVYYKIAIEAGQSATFLFTARVPRDRRTQFNAMVKLGSTKTNLKHLDFGYKQCETATASNCYLTDQELLNKGTKKLSKTDGMITFGSFEYNPDLLFAPLTTHVYMFAVHNPNAERVFAEFKVDSLATFAETMEDDSWYANSRRAGETVYYMFDTAAYDAENIMGLTITLETLNGDADLFVSQKVMSPSRDTSYDYSSQLDTKFDQVEI